MKYLLLSIALLVGLSSCTYHNNDHDHPTVYKSDYKTFVYTISPNNWIDGGELLFSEINAPELTNDMLKYGYFITYINIGSDDNPIYSELPQTLFFADNEGVPYTLEMYPTYKNNTVRIEYFDTHPTNKQFPDKSYSFRTVIISDPYVINGLKNNEISREYESVIRTMNELTIDNKQIILD